MASQNEEPVKAESTSPSNVQDMMSLVRHMRTTQPGMLDETTILAIAESSGVSPELVRMSLAEGPESERLSGIDRLRGVVMSMDPGIRRYATSVWLALVTSGLSGFAAVFGDHSSLLGTISMCGYLFFVAMVATAPQRKISAITGALFAGSFQIGYSLILFLIDILSPYHVPDGIWPGLLIVIIAAGAVLGLFINTLWHSIRKRLGLRNAVDERRALLTQLVSLQDRLRQHERSMTFLSLDIVGSTRIKDSADALAVEFTFGEYQRFVEVITMRNGGTVHSTAGDGTICAFDSPIAAFRSARQIQGGLFEFNTARNRIGIPIQLRAGIHTGTIIPQGPEVTNVNFSQVIDIAAHLQKDCPIGCVMVSEPAYLELGFDEAMLEPDPVEISGVSAKTWRPKTILDVAKLEGAASPAQ